ncbi:MAG TPA: hypothetical protein VIM16_03785 [Mucilaginibacter sp.]|jgi:hypothetical protein
MKKPITGTVIATLLLPMVIVITGCGPSYYIKRDVKKLDVLSLQYNTEFTRLSNELNPCFTGVAKSDTIVKHTADTIINQVERLVPGKPGRPDTLYLQGKTIRNNVFITVHDTVWDNRALNACTVIGKVTSDSLLIIKTQNIQLKTVKSGLIKWVTGLAVALLLFLGTGVYRFVSGGAIAETVKELI